MSGAGLKFHSALPHRGHIVTLSLSKGDHATALAKIMLRQAQHDKALGTCKARRERRHVKSYWVYLLHCSDGSYYAGITGNIDARVYQHNHGLDGPRSYTKSRRPIMLVFAALYYDVEQAIAFEKQIKGWSRAKKEALMRGDYSALKSLARNYASLRTNVSP